MALGRIRLFPLLVASVIGCAAASVPELASQQWPLAHASVSVEIPLRTLARNASRVVLGTALESRSVWEDDEGGARRIVTYHRVRVDRQVSGTGPDELWVRCLGGSVEGIGQRVEGEAALRTGVKAMVFLSPRAGGTFSVLAMAQGMYPVQKGADGVERLGRVRAPGVLVRSREGFAAVALLPGKTIDEAAQLVREARLPDAP